MESEIFISPEKEEQIKDIVTEEIGKLHNMDLKAMQAKLGEIVSTKLAGETWICLLEK